MRPRHVARGPNKVEQNMTPMIDVVFQLLAFFIMSFKVPLEEGNFNINMPASAPSQGQSDELYPPIKLKLTAGADGRLASIQMGPRVLSSFQALRQEVLAIAGSSTGPGSIIAQTQVELDCDYALHYDNVIQAITAVSGYRNAAGQVIPLAEKIKFIPQKSSPGT